MPEPLFQRLVIYGVGLLGGSLGMAARGRGLAARVVGLGRSLDRLGEARRLGAIDEAATDPARALAGADALILAVPPARIREGLAGLAPLLAPGAFVTDVGSVKGRIVAEAERVLPPEILFIGSHPMAGSEKTGAGHGRPDFYEASACILTPTPRTRPEALALAARFWRAVGARLAIAAPDRHDELLAGISHLPHLAASALLASLSPRLATPLELAALAGGGLRDTTRIAGSDAEIWKEIFAENRPALLAALDAYLETLRTWREALASSEPDIERLAALFNEGRTVRQSFHPGP